MDAIKCLNECHDEKFAAYNGDCVDVVRQLPDNSVDFAVYSPPFSGLYIYNDSVADMGNCKDDAEFFEHYRYLVKELYRVMRPGRIAAIHCKDLVYYRNQNGTAGLRDFPGDIIRCHIDAGFDYHSRVTVWRCPVHEMTKTKAHGLLYKQLRSDSSFSRQGLPEYMIIMRKWADESQEGFIKPAAHATIPTGINATQLDSFIQENPSTITLPEWQDLASPVWMDTDMTDVLNFKAVKQPGDEKHICPMPLDITKRCIKLWTTPGDVVLSPFMGIGSEGVSALSLGRRFIGVELKESYFKQACRYLKAETAQGYLGI